MQKSALFISSLGLACFAGMAYAGGPVPFVYVNETATRLSGTPTLTTTDTMEKDYAWDDLDQDGDIDLVVVRKVPFTNPGGRPSVLLMNVNGVLTDQTATYAATAIGIPVGFTDTGFLAAANNRDVIIIDVNGDNWLDVVTATTISDGLPKHVGHPRVYINQGMVGPVWGGLVYDNNRIPAMLTSSLGPQGQAQTPTLGFNPRFCSVTGGDLTGDNRPELYFGDYDSSGDSGSGEPAGIDFNQKLLLNDGAGNFTDVTTTRITATAVPDGSTYPAWRSAFGAAAAIADMNNDGRNDIIYQTSLTPPEYIAITYNSVVTPGFFSSPAQVLFPQATSQPYFVSVADLNNDGRLDVIETDDNTDQYRLNTAIGAPGAPATFASAMNFPGDTAGFGAQNIAADLNNDTWKDVLIADVDVDIFGCSRVSDILLNNANPPNVTFATNTGGIPASMLQGVHNIAVFDINDDGWLDLVMGRCTGTQVWMFDAPAPVCPADINGDGVVDGLDLGAMLAQWGGPGSADLNGSGIVDGLDLGQLLADWSIPAGSPGCA
jgi:hypothetical protein